MSDHAEATLRECLRAFSARVNAHAKVARLISGWNRTLIVEATDTHVVASLSVVGGVVSENPPDSNPGDLAIVQVEAEQQMLEGVFSGTENPANAFLDGQLAVFADDADQVKLDAIVMLLWK